MTRKNLPSEGFARLPQVLAVVGISKSTIERRIAKGEFPAPVRLGKRCNVWNVREVRAWIEETSRAEPTGTL